MILYAALLGITLIITKGRLFYGLRSFFPVLECSQCVGTWVAAVSMIFIGYISQMSEWEFAANVIAISAIVSLLGLAADHVLSLSSAYKTYLECNSNIAVNETKD